MAELPTDIIIKILSKLPVKSLLRFQCVSKSWKSLIKSPNFIKIHLNQTLTSYSNRHLLVSVEYSSLHSSEFDLTNNSPSLCFSALNPPHEKFHFVGTYNGVVCISSISKRENFLFNPLTNSCHKLPSAEIPIPEFNMTLLGFGYDRNNDDYKVLKIIQGLGKLDDSKNKAQVYSLKNNSWKCIQGIPYALYYGYYDGVLVNDYLHYVVTREPSSERLLIASFNLLTESFSHMECPDYDDQFTSFHSVFTLVELGGCLCLLINFYGNDEMLFDDDDDDLLNELDARVLKCVELWVMKEYGKKESWVRLFAIRHPETMGSSRVIRPVVCSEDGRKFLLEIDVLRYGWYGWYDLESKKFDLINAYGLPKGLINTKVFIGSLVSLEVEDKLLSQKEAVPMKSNKKKNVDNFLSDGFKLKL